MTDKNSKEVGNFGYSDEIINKSFKAGQESNHHNPLTCNKCLPFIQQARQDELKSKILLIQEQARNQTLEEVEKIIDDEKKRCRDFIKKKI